MWPCVHLWVKGSADRNPGSRREQLKNKLFRKSSLRASKNKKVRKEKLREATRAYEVQEDEVDTEKNPVEPSSEQLPPFQKKFYMDEYRDLHEDSRDAARLLFELMIAPYSVDKFFRWFIFLCTMYAKACS